MINIYRIVDLFQTIPIVMMQPIRAFYTSPVLYNLVFF